MSKRNLKPSGEGWVQLIAGLGFIVLLIVINIIDPTISIQPCGTWQRVVLWRK